jgi:hypothetical protein
VLALKNRIYKWRSGDVEQPRKLMRYIAEGLGVTENWLRGTEDERAIIPPSKAVITSREVEGGSQMSARGDGRLVDWTRSTGEVRKFFEKNMRPGREAWQILHDVVDVCPVGSYVVVDLEAAPIANAVVLAELLSAEGTMPIFRTWMFDRLMNTGAPVDEPILMINDRVKVRGPVVDCWTHP